jgi:hypothetical protein
MQMHEAVRDVYLALVAEGGAIMRDDSELERLVVAAFAANGLAEHGYASDYRTLALTMVRYFVSIRKGHTREVPTALNLAFGNEQIVVTPDDLLMRPDGGRTLRRVKTGHRTSNETEDVGAAAFVLAAGHAFPGSTVELVHLADQQVTPLDLSGKKLQNRRDKLVGFLNEIRRGLFPAAPSSRVCPGCPAFFVCGPTPPGILQKKF